MSIPTFPNKMPNILINFDGHNGVPIKYGLHVGGGQLSWIGLVGEKKNNKGTIFADNEEVVSEGHTSSLIVPHYNIVPPWPPNALIPILILFSKSKCVFSVQSVVGTEDGPIAVCVYCYVGINLACWDPVGIPSSYVFNSSTVLLGFTFADYVKGLLSMLVDAAIDLIFYVLFNNRLYKKTLEKLFKKVLKKPMLLFLRNTPLFKNIARSFAEKGTKGFISTAEEMSKNFIESTIKEFTTNKELYKKIGIEKIDFIPKKIDSWKESLISKFETLSAGD